MRAGTAGFHCNDSFDRNLYAYVVGIILLALYNLALSAARTMASLRSDKDTGLVKKSSAFALKHFTAACWV